MKSCSNSEYCIYHVDRFIVNWTFVFNIAFQFAVVYKARNNAEIVRDNVILWVAEAVNKEDTYKHKVNLSNPDLVILVEIIKASSV